MEIHVSDVKPTVAMEPLTCRRGFRDVYVGGKCLPDAIADKVSAVDAESSQATLPVTINSNVWPSVGLIEKLLAAPIQVLDASQHIVAYSGNKDDAEETMTIDSESRLLVYPWDIIAVNEEIVSALDHCVIEGELSDRATIEGNLVLGEGSRVLPGVFIEGNVIVGKNCKLGPNCYVRGNSYIMDNCHIGQAVEIKNSILMNNVSAGHLSYIGDSIVCPFANFGAGTVTANFRHDGKNHRSMVEGDLIDTGRRKFGSIIGDNVHTGIHTGIYPGRKIWPDMMTRPGDIVQKDLKG